MMYMPAQTIVPGSFVLPKQPGKNISVLCYIQTETIEEWEQGLQTALQRIAPKGKVSLKTIIQDKKQTRSWWNSFWQRSFIEAEGEAKEITRNYTLFRYMLGCNAYGSVPTKFNGGLLPLILAMSMKNNLLLPTTGNGEVVR